MMGFSFFFFSIYNSVKKTQMGLKTNKKNALKRNKMYFKNLKLAKNPLKIWFLKNKIRIFAKLILEIDV